MPEPTLVVPVTLDALVVDAAVLARDGLRWWPFNYLALRHFRSPEPEAFDRSVGGQGPGVYLHWELPAALRTGAHDPATGEVDYPLVPNRWLVVRYQGTTTRTATGWVIESDCPFTSQVRIVTSAQTSAYLADPALITAWKASADGWRNTVGLSPTSKDPQVANIGIPFELAVVERAVRGTDVPHRRRAGQPLLRHLRPAQPRGVLVLRRPHRGRRRHAQLLGDRVVLRSRPRHRRRLDPRPDLTRPLRGPADPARLGSERLHGPPHPQPVRGCRVRRAVAPRRHRRTVARPAAGGPRSGPTRRGHRQHDSRRVPGPARGADPGRSARPAPGADAAPHLPVRPAPAVGRAGRGRAGGARRRAVLVRVVARGAPLGDRAPPEPAAPEPGGQQQRGNGRRHRLRSRRVTPHGR